MKNKLKLKHFLIVSAVSLALSFLIMAFILMSFNPTEWEKLNRVSVLLFWFAFSLIGAALIDIHHNN